jgi:hypothetical protein
MANNLEPGVEKKSWKTVADWTENDPSETFGQQKRLERLRRGEVAEALPHRIRSDGDRASETRTPWIRTKKNDAKISRLGMNIWDILLIAALVFVIGLVATGYQFHFWDWACGQDGCAWISESFLNHEGSQ